MGEHRVPLELWSALVVRAKKSENQGVCWKWRFPAFLGVEVLNFGVVVWAYITQRIKVNSLLTWTGDVDIYMGTMTRSISCLFAATWANLEVEFGDPNGKTGTGTF